MPDNSRFQIEGFWVFGSPRGSRSVFGKLRFPAFVAAFVAAFVEKMANPTKVATKVAAKVFVSETSHTGSPAAPAVWMVLLSAWLPLGSARAAEPAANAPAEPPPLRAEVRSDNEAGSVPMRRAFVTAGTNRFAFSVPEGFRLEVSNQDFVSLVSADYHSLLTFRIAAPFAAATVQPQTATWRQSVLQQHPDAKILQEFTLTAADRSGPAFDATWSSAGSLLRRQRVAFIPSRAGILEVSLICAPEAFDKARHDLNFLLLTFRASDAQGRLELPRFSDKF
jgi:hypothetical protein